MYTYFHIDIQIYTYVYMYMYIDICIHTHMQVEGIKAQSEATTHSQATHYIDVHISRCRNLPPVDQDFATQANARTHTRTRARARTHTFVTYT